MEKLLHQAPSVFVDSSLVSVETAERCAEAGVHAQPRSGYTGRFPPALTQPALWATRSGAPLRLRASGRRLRDELGPQRIHSHTSGEGEKKSSQERWMNCQTESGRSEHARFWDMTENCLVRARQQMDERENSPHETARVGPEACASCWLPS